jgi:hypothetical protein
MGGLWFKVSMGKKLATPPSQFAGHGGTQHEVRKL